MELKISFKYFVYWLWYKVSWLWKCDGYFTSASDVKKALVVVTVILLEIVFAVEA